MLRELARSYLTIVKDLSRVMNRLKALYRSWAIPCAGRDSRETEIASRLSVSVKNPPISGAFLWWWPVGS
jgi:hypothetical protein